MLKYITNCRRRVKLINAFNDISNALYNNGISYNEIDELLSDIVLYYKEQREHIEYATPKDYFENNKRCDVGDCILEPLSDELKELLGLL